VFARLLLSILALLAGTAARAAEPETHHVDLARWAWESPASERRDRALLAAAIDSLARATRQPPPSAPGLRELLRLADRVSVLTRWHGDYLHLASSIDTRDEASARAEDSLGIAEEAALARVQAVLQRLDARRLETWLAADPRLAPYRAFVAESRRRGARPLSTTEQELANQATSWQFRLYQSLNEHLEWPLDPRALQASPDSALRAQAQAKVSEGYARNRDLYAFALQRTVRAQNAAARARGFPDAPALYYDRRQWTTDDVRGLVAAVRARGAVFKRYEAARERARALLRGAPAPRLSLAETRAAMRDALSPLGPELARELEALLDPASGRLELGPGEHRRRGGFSFALPSGPHGVYLDGFGGTIPEVSRLVHESGHALHYTLFESAGAPRVYSPAFSEAVAQFGEVLVAERLASTAPDPAVAIAWRQQFLIKSLELFLGAQDAELEQSLYDHVDSLDTADALDRLTARVDSAYTSDRRPGAAGRWMRVGLLYEDPLYLSNYLYSGFLITALHRRFVADPQAFAPRYAAFMREPSAAPPAEMLRRTLGVSFADPAVLRDALQLLETQIAAFEAQLDRYAAARR
jgi:oligoendopeptidase F